MTPKTLMTPNITTKKLVQCFWYPWSRYCPLSLRSFVVSVLCLNLMRTPYRGTK